MIRRLSSLLVFLLLLNGTGLADTVSPAEDGTKAPAETEIIAKVNGRTITQMDLEGELNRLIPRSFFHQSVTEEKKQSLREKALRNLIDKELKIQEAERLGLTVPAEEIDTELEKIIATFPDRKSFRKQLEAGGFNMEDARNEIRRRKLAKLITQKEVMEKVQIAEKDAREYYEKNKEKFIQPPRYHLRDILLKVPPLANDFDRKTIQDKAEAVVRKIRSGEVTFDEAVKQYSEDANRDKGGDMGTLHQGQLNSKIEKEIAKLLPGKIAGPLKTFRGFYIFQMVGILPERLSPFDEVKEKLIRELTYEAVQNREKAWLEKLRGKAKIIISE